MSTPKQNRLEQAIAIAQRDQISPIPCAHRDTGEALWLVQSRSDPTRYYLLTTTGDSIRCVCPQARHRGICAHAAAVRLALQAESPQHVPAARSQHHQPTPPQPAREQPRLDSRMEKERRERAGAELRERALLWTDDQPFSIWKS